MNPDHHQNQLVFSQHYHISEINQKLLQLQIINITLLNACDKVNKIEQKPAINDITGRFHKNRTEIH